MLQEVVIVLLLLAAHLIFLWQLFTTQLAADFHPFHESSHGLSQPPYLRPGPPVTPGNI